MEGVPFAQAQDADAVFDSFAERVAGRGEIGGVK